MVSFQRKRLQLENFDNLQPLVEKFKVHILNIPHNWRILESKGMYVHSIFGPMEGSQLVV